MIGGAKILTILGSSKLIINSVESALKQSNLHLNDDGKQGLKIKVVDFQSAVFFVDHVLTSAYNKEQKSNFLTSPLIKVSPDKKAFSPGMYEIEDVDFDGEENDEDDDEQEDHDLESSNLAHEEKYRPHQISRPKSAIDPAKVYFNINLVPSSNKDQKKETEPANMALKSILETSFHLQNFTVSATQKKELAIETQRSLKSQTAYDRVLSDQEINSYLSYLKQEFIKEHNEEEKLILIVRDVTELIEYTKIDSGKKLFFGFMDLVSQLRLAKIPSVLIASCTPSLMEPKNIKKDIDFYTQIIDGNLPNFSSKGNLTMAADGSLFQTCLDSFEDHFDKVQLLPPAKTFHSLRCYKDRNSGVKSFKKNEHKLLLFQYLSEQEKDMKLRIAEINIKMILETCLARGITLKFPIWDLVTDQKAATVSNLYTHSSYKHGLKRSQSAIESYALELLTREIWNYGIVDKLVKLALGSQLDSSDFKNDTQIDSIELDNFEVALKIMYETDITRCPSVLQHEVSPAEGEGGTEKLIEESQPSPSNQASVLKPNTVFNTTDSTTNRSDDDTIASEMRRLGIKLSKHEKRILSTVVNPHRLKVEFKDLILPSPTKLLLQTLVTLPLLRPEFFQTGILSRSSINGVLLFGNF